MTNRVLRSRVCIAGLSAFAISLLPCAVAIAQELVPPATPIVGPTSEVEARLRRLEQVNRLLDTFSPTEQKSFPQNSIHRSSKDLTPEQRGIVQSLAPFLDQGSQMSGFFEAADSTLNLTIHPYIVVYTPGASPLMVEITGKATTAGSDSTEEQRKLSKGVALQRRQQDLLRRLRTVSAVSIPDSDLIAPQTWAKLSKSQQESIINLSSDVDPTMRTAFQGLLSDPKRREGAQVRLVLDLIITGNLAGNQDITAIRLVP